MYTHHIDDAFGKCQTWMCAQVRDFSASHKQLSRLGAIPVSIGDVVLETLKTPLSGIERIACAAINLLKAFFSNDHSIKDFLRNTEDALFSIVKTPIVTTTAPFKLCYQILAMGYDPEHATPYHQ